MKQVLHIVVLGVLFLCGAQEASAQTWQNRLYGRDYNGGYPGANGGYDSYVNNARQNPPVSEPPPSSGPACVNHCLARGNMPEVCNDQCGMVKSDGVFYDPGYDPGKQYDPRDSGYPDQEDVRKNQEDARDGGPSDRRRPGGGNQRGGTPGMDFDCFRDCRDTGNSYDDCTDMCRQ